LRCFSFGQEVDLQVEMITAIRHHAHPVLLH
jgi:hypothetical protein